MLPVTYRSFLLFRRWKLSRLGGRHFIYEDSKENFQGPPFGAIAPEKKSFPFVYPQYSWRTGQSASVKLPDSDWPLPPTCPGKMTGSVLANYSIVCSVIARWSLWKMCLGSPICSTLITFRSGKMLQIYSLGEPCTLEGERKSEAVLRRLSKTKRRDKKWLWDYQH